MSLGEWDIFTLQMSNIFDCILEFTFRETHSVPAMFSPLTYTILDQRKVPSIRLCCRVHLYDHGFLCMSLDRKGPSCFCKLNGYSDCVRSTAASSVDAYFTMESKFKLIWSVSHPPPSPHHHHHHHSSPLSSSPPPLSSSPPPPSSPFSSPSSSSRILSSQLPSLLVEKLLLVASGGVEVRFDHMVWCLPKLFCVFHCFSAKQQICSWRLVVVAE